MASALIPSAGTGVALTASSDHVDPAGKGSIGMECQGTGQISQLLANPSELSLLQCQSKIPA